MATSGGRLTVAMFTLRWIAPGEELTFDYSSVTESETEYRSAVCLCGTRGCRGSFLHWAGSPAYQTARGKTPQPAPFCAPAAPRNRRPSPDKHPISPQYSLALRSSPSPTPFSSATPSSAAPVWTPPCPRRRPPSSTSGRCGARRSAGGAGSPRRCRGCASGPRSPSGSSSSRRRREPGPPGVSPLSVLLSSLPGREPPPTHRPRVPSATSLRGFAPYLTRFPPRLQELSELLPSLVPDRKLTPELAREEARAIAENRLQNLVITLDKVRPHGRRAAPPRHVVCIPPACTAPPVSKRPSPLLRPAACEMTAQEPSWEGACLRLPGTRAAGLSAVRSTGP